MSEHRTRTTHRPRPTRARRAAALALGSLTFVGLSAGLAGTASALTPAPQPDLPLVVEQPDVDPPVPPVDPPGPQGPVGPLDLATPTTMPDPFPVPPPHPGDLTIGEDDPEQPDPGPGPDDGVDGDGLPEGPDELTAEPDPTDPDDEPDPTVPETTVPGGDEPEVLDASESAASEDSLALTGNDTGLVVAGAALLGAGAIAAGVATAARRRASATSTDPTA